MSAAKPVILCVDDEKTVLNSLRQELEYSLGTHYVFELAESAEEGIEILNDLFLQGHDVPVVISDQLMPGMKGDEFLAHVHKLSPDVRTILLTGQASAQSVGNAVNQAGLFRYIAKPWDDKDLRLSVEEAAKSYFLNRQLSAQVKVLSDLNLATKLLSEEVNPEQLARKFLRLAVSDTEADRGLIVLDTAAGPLMFSGSVLANRSYLDNQWLGRDELAQVWPLKLLDHARVGSGPLCLANASEVGDFAREADVRRLQTRSVLAHPIEGSEGTVGVIYLESARIKFFARERIEFISLLSAHAGICLDNALLYQNLEAKVQERTRVITEKTEQITDSIEYARRIQQAILPNVSVLGQAFADALVFYLPKDIVSGDFYWFSEVGGDLVIAAVDCTGHGVPGAFMAVLGNNLLTQVVKEGRTTQPDRVLERLHHAVREALKQYDPSAQIQDGMDMAVLRFRGKDRTQVEFAGARRPLWLVRAGTLTEVKASRSPVGGSQHGVGATDTAHYSLETIGLSQGDMLYLTTDGLADQFGGPDGRKFSPRRLQEVLIALAPLPISEQAQRLRQHLDLWRGTRPQTDDILLIGLSI